MTLIEILEGLKQCKSDSSKDCITNISDLAEEAKKRLENGELNDIAKGEVEEYKLDDNRYKFALNLL